MSAQNRRRAPRGPRDPKVPGRSIIEAANKEADLVGLCLPNQQILEEIGDKNNEREIAAPTGTTKEIHMTQAEMQQQIDQLKTQLATQAVPAVPQTGAALAPAAAKSEEKASRLSEDAGEYALDTLGKVVTTAAVGLTVIGVFKVGQMSGVFMTPEQKVEAYKSR